MSALVQTNYGSVEGTKEGSVYVWKGVPYAKPPVGDLRFHPPQPPERWEGIRETKQFSPYAAQPPMHGVDQTGMVTSEDCLYLNIWSPGADDKLRPVMVWIHGGGFTGGSGAQSWYNGASFAENGDVVAVTLNYRLGVLGFLHFGEIGGEEYATSGNCGILDQVAALQWVKENIAAFGGDPNKVTIFGESAGAMSVGTLLAMPSARGLFQRAILQSGGASAVSTVETATKHAKQVLAALEIGEDELSRLADIPVERLLEAAASLPPMSFLPVIDGVSLPQHPMQAFESGFNMDIPIMLGTNLEEFRFFMLQDRSSWQLDDEGIINRCKQMSGPLWPKISPYYLEEDTASGRTVLDKMVSLLTWRMFTYSVVKLAETLVKQGAPVWMYRFDWKSPAFDGVAGACHVLDIPFVFNTLDSSDSVNISGTSPDRKALADQMHYAWIEFARHGNPNTPKIPDWPQFDLTNRSTLIFNMESHVENDPQREEREAWERALA